MDCFERPRQGKRNTITILAEHSEGRGHLGDRGADGRIILKWILKILIDVMLQ
jgi:hypothetical protein